MNQYIDIPLLTGMHAGRNFMNIISSDVVIFVSIGSPGTLSELAFAIQMERPSIVMHGSEKLKSYIDEILNGVVMFADSLSELETNLKKLLS